MKRNSPPPELVAPRSSESSLPSLPRLYVAPTVESIRNGLDALAVNRGLLLEWEPVATARERLYDTRDWRLRRAGLSLWAHAGVGAPGLLLARRRGSAATVVLRAGTVPGREGAELDLPPLEDLPTSLAAPIRAVAGREDVRGVLELETACSEGRLAAGPSICRILLERVRIPGTAGAEVALAEVAPATEDTAAAGQAWLWLERLDGLRPEPDGRQEAILCAAGRPLPPVLPEAAPLPAGEGARSIAALAHTVMRRQVSRLLECEPAARLGEDLEGVHRMRVATRRLRAALRLFPGVVPHQERLLEELRWVGQGLGEVRDLDVQLQRLQAALAEGDPGAPEKTAALLQPLAARHRRARRRMLRLLDSRRYERLIRRVAELTRGGPSPRMLRYSPSARTASPGLIVPLAARIESKAAQVRKSASPSRLHRLRIRCKALRYALEFHLDVYGDEVKPMVTLLKKAQELLGDHQDAVVEQALLAGLVRDEGRRLPPEAVFAAGRLAEAATRRAKELRRRVAGMLNELTGKRWNRLWRVMAAAPGPDR